MAAALASNALIIRSRSNNSTLPRALSGFVSYVKSAKPKEQYFVFLIRPSGIALFKDLVEAARGSGFEVGFDALEEDKEIHFTPPPPIDDEATTTPRSGNPAGPPGRAGGNCSVCVS